MDNLKENCYTISDYSKMTTFSRGTIYRKIKGGKLKKIEFGGKVFVHDEHLKERIVGAAQEKEIKRKLYKIKILKEEVRDLRKEMF